MIQLLVKPIITVYELSIMDTISESVTTNVDNKGLEWTDGSKI